MRFFLFVSTVLTLCLTGIVPFGRLYAQGGKTGLTFLKIPLGARATALGNAGAAFLDGADATLSNPAGVPSGFSESQSTEIVAGYKQWIQDASLQFLGVAFRLGSREALAVSVAASSSGPIELRTRPGPAEGSFSARNVALALSYARPLAGDLVAGVTLKLLYEKILVDEAAGFGLDAGLRWDAPVEGLRVGASLMQMGSMQNLRAESTILPTALRAGAAWTGYVAESAPLLTAAADIVYSIPERRMSLFSGIEVDLLDALSMRGGYQAGTSSGGFSAGAGVRYGIAGLDYAFAPLRSDLGNTHTIGVRLTF